jgi:hypothetical protein
MDMRLMGQTRPRDGPNMRLDAWIILMARETNNHGVHEVKTQWSQEAEIVLQGRENMGTNREEKVPKMAFNSFLTI